ncbi:aldose 1-epimerase family protein [Microbacterium saperdae]|uniref:Aldose 1-epimerase n=1 Tax=Microbacterium saperdae TaxID=69368 RepID=A0A543BBV8_9MICO|nr:aldose 1-epimerase family protein [Microbacterium saperdae]TQL82324.1 aldose 1-epimerase [Microbacterium saperdae]GGM38924.1 aldose 1-epimerase [Microbacterium saperdae]
MSTASPTGTQIALQLGEVTAQIAQVGASLRSLRIGGVDLVAPYPLALPTPACSGVVLAPWPNRVRDGRWDDDGTARQLAITEPKLSNASHGLLRFTAYEITQTESAVTLSATIVPQTGYPYLIETAVTYVLTTDGIEVTHTLTNRSETAAPVALGTHPFLTIGDVDPQDLVLRVPAATQFETDERMLPTGTTAAPQSLRDGARLGDVTLDTGFTDLTRDADGLVRHSLTAPDGRRVSLWQGEGFDFVQVYTTPRYPGQSLAVAIEPMTAPADAFNSGLGVRRLAPDESWILRWGITLD